MYEQQNAIEQDMAFGFMNDGVEEEYQQDDSGEVWQLLQSCEKATYYKYKRD